MKNIRNHIVRNMHFKKSGLHEDKKKKKLSEEAQKEIDKAHEETFTDKELRKEWYDTD